MASIPARSYNKISRIYHVHVCFCAQLIFFNDTATTEIYTLSLHDALPISTRTRARCNNCCSSTSANSSSAQAPARSEEHTSELQSHSDLVCRLLLENKKYELRTIARQYKTSSWWLPREFGTSRELRTVLTP